MQSEAMGRSGADDLRRRRCRAKRWGGAAPMTRDPLAPLMELPGVAAASEQAREALGRAHRHRANLRRWTVTAEESALRAARAAVVLDGGWRKLDDHLDLSAISDPVFAGALRVAQALEGGETNLVG